MHSLTAANLLVPAAKQTADSNHGIGGVCKVVTVGTGTAAAIATGRWWRLLLWMMSNRSAPVRVSSSISPR